MDAWFEEWLKKTNEHFRQQELPYISRPFEAMSRLSQESGIAIRFPSELAASIFKWFEQHSPAGAHAIGSLFTSCFYYDAYFWRVEIPIVYGIVELNALDGLGKMPKSILEQFQKERVTLWQYISLWTDSMDYAFGFDDLERGQQLSQKGNHLFATKLVSSADRELRGCIGLLTDANIPNPKALESARMAMEMFLKAFLAIHSSLTEEDAQKKFGHNLEKLTDACNASMPSADVDELRQFVKVFPAIGSRYEGVLYENQRLWSGFAAALRTGVTFTRSVTGRDSRNRITVRPN